MINKKKSKKEHWQKIHRKNNYLINAISNFKVLQGYCHFVLSKIVNRFWSKNYKNFIEIGCAPGNYLIKFKKYFNIDVFGVEYSEEGYHKTLENIKNYGISASNIALDDFFNSNFLENNKEKYNIVFSSGFIEHFDNPDYVIEKQKLLLKSSGLIICIIPNVKFINKLLAGNKLLEIHNQKIMDIKTYKSIFEKCNLKIEYCDYFGGLINFGLFGNKKGTSKAIFAFLFFIQRLFIDNIQKIIFLLTKKDLTSKFTSPSLICIARKK